MDVLKAYALYTTHTSASALPKPISPTSPPSSDFWTSLPITSYCLQHILSSPPNMLSPSTKAPPIPTNSNPLALDTSTVVSLEQCPPCTVWLDLHLHPPPIRPIWRQLQGRHAVHHPLNLTLAKVNKYIDMPKPLCAILALDIINMLNEVSRKAIQAKLAKIPVIAVLIPYFNTSLMKNPPPAGSEAMTVLTTPSSKTKASLSRAFSSIVQRQLMLFLNAGLLCH